MTDLTASLSDLLGAEVHELRRLSGGASRETWSFDVRREGADRPEPLILRRDPVGAPKGGMAVEARLFAVAGAAGVPVPRVLHASDDPAVLGSSFLVMERIEGETIPRKILRDDEHAAARAGLAAQCGEVLAKLHAIPPESVEGLAEQDPVSEFMEMLDTLGEPHPAFELAFRFLAANRPPPARRSIVHGDFRNGNFIVGPEGLRVVLDWELAHVGDPIEDLGWLCVKSWRFGAAAPVGGFGTYEELCDAYAAAGGGAVDLDALRWWELMGTVKWGIMCILQATAHVSGAVRSVELAAIGRRVCEVEHDVLMLLQ